MKKLESISEIWKCYGTYDTLCIELTFDFYELYKDLLFNFCNNWDFSHKYKIQKILL